MKKYLTILIALVVLLAAYPIFGQREGRSTGRRGGGAGMFMLTPEQREKWRDMSQEEREKLMAEMREKWQNMSEAEREKARAQMRERFGSGRRFLGREEQLKAIKAIEKQLAKLKANIEAMGERRSFRDLSEEERTKLRERFAKAREVQQTATKTIIAQIAMLQGQRQPTAEGEELIIVNTGELKAIRELAVKEKAKETAQRLERISRGRRGFGGRPTGPRTRPTRTPPRTRPTTPRPSPTERPQGARQR